MGRATRQLPGPQNGLPSYCDDARFVIATRSLATAAGARAMARAALSVAVRDSDGGIICDYTAEWLAFNVVEFLADQDDKQGGHTA